MVKRMLILMSIFVLLALMQVYAQAIFDITLIFYKDNGVEVGKLNIIEGTTLLPDNNGDYGLILVSKEGKSLYETRFNIQFETHEDLIIDGKKQARDITIDKINVPFRFPFNSEVHFLEVYYGEKKLISYKIELCNNNKVCENLRTENYLSCPYDCSSGSDDNYCDEVLDGRCDSDCVVKELDVDCTCGDNICGDKENNKTCPEDCSKSGKKHLFTSTYLMVLLILIILLIGFRVFKKKQVKRFK